MALYRYNLRIIEARQLKGTATETMDVINWVRNRGGYHWLVGNATEPATLVPEGGGNPGDEGVYLDPVDGSFVIHTAEKDMRAKYGDYILCDDEDKFELWEPADFEATYIPA